MILNWWRIQWVNTWIILRSTCAVLMNWIQRWIWKYRAGTWRRRWTSTCRARSILDSEYPSSASAWGDSSSGQPSTILPNTNPTSTTTCLCLLLIWDAISTPTTSSTRAWSSSKKSTTHLASSKWEWETTYHYPQLNNNTI